MKKSDNYMKLVRWSKQESCYVGTCPTITSAVGDVVVRGSDEVETYRELCKAVERWIHATERQGVPLPPSDMSDEYTDFVKKIFNLLLPYEMARNIDGVEPQKETLPVDPHEADRDSISYDIDHDFISELEGGRKMIGYIPHSPNNHSGVTIATGFDLGQRNGYDLQLLKLSKFLMDVLTPYLGLKGSAAHKMLSKRPLHISTRDAQIIDESTRVTHVKRLATRYDDKDTPVFFHQLPRSAQTIIMSVSFQYGLNLAIRTPVFWSLAKIRDWPRVTKELENFKDDYPSRRNKEAVYFRLAKWS